MPKTPRHGDLPIGFLAPSEVSKPHRPLQVVDNPSNGLIKDGFRSGSASWFWRSDACAFRFWCFVKSDFGVSWLYGLISAFGFCSLILFLRDVKFSKMWMWVKTRTSKPPRQDEHPKTDPSNSDPICSYFERTPIEGPSHMFHPLWNHVFWWMFNSHGGKDSSTT